MDSSHVAKLRSLYARGAIAALEIATGSLVELVKDDGFVAESTSRLNDLPSKVRRSLHDLLRQIERADYQWRPFVLGPGGPIRRSASEDATRVRQLCATLDIAHWPEPSIPGGIDANGKADS